LRILDSETLWTINIRTVVLLLNSVDAQLNFTQRDVVDTLNALYDNNRDEEIDFDEFLYQMALLDKVSKGKVYHAPVWSVCGVLTSLSVAVEPVGG